MGALVQIVHLFLSLGKGKEYLLFGQIGSVAVQRIHNARNKSVCCGTAGLWGRANLPLQRLLVCICVNVRFFQKAQVHTALIQCLIQSASFLGATAHAGDTVKHNGVPRLHSV